MSVKFLDTWEPNGDFPIARDIHMEGGFRVILWSTSNYANVTLALAALVPDSFRKRGMVIRAIETTTGDTTEFTFDGSTFVTYAPVNTPSPGFGMISGGAVTANDTNLILSIAGATLIDRLGKKITFGSTTIDISALYTAQSLNAAIGDVWVVVWDPLMNSGAGGLTARVMKSGQNQGASPEDLPITLAKVSKPGASFLFAAADVIDIRRWDTGENSREWVTVGNTTGSVFANFDSLRKALLWINSFRNNTAANTPVLGVTVGAFEQRPKTIYVVSDMLEPFVDGGVISIDTTNTFWFDANSRLEGMRIVGASSSVGESQPRIYCGLSGQTGFFLGFAQVGIRNWTVENLRLSHNGDISTTDNNCFFKNVHGGFVARKLQIISAGRVGHLAFWDVSHDFGGRSSNDGNQASIFEQLHVSGGIASGATSYFKFGTGVISQGTLIVRDSYFSTSTAKYNYFMEWANTSGADTLILLVEHCRIADINTALFFNSGNAIKNIDHTQLMGNTTSGALTISIATGTTGVPVEMVQCVFGENISFTVNLAGARGITNCVSRTNITVISAATNCIVNCDFGNPGGAGASFNISTPPKLLVYGAPAYTDGAQIRASSLTLTGGATIGGAVGIGGALTGVTSLSMNGALTGPTSIALSGAVADITGARDVSASRTISTNATSTVPAFAANPSTATTALVERVVASDVTDRGYRKFFVNMTSTATTPTDLVLTVALPTTHCSFMVNVKLAGHLYNNASSVNNSYGIGIHYDIAGVVGFNGSTPVGTLTAIPLSVTPWRVQGNSIYSPADAAFGASGSDHPNTTPWIDAIVVNVSGVPTLRIFIRTFDASTVAIGSAPQSTRWTGMIEVITTREE